MAREGNQVAMGSAAAESAAVDAYCPLAGRQMKPGSASCTLLDCVTDGAARIVGGDIDKRGIELAVTVEIAGRLWKEGGSHRGRRGEIDPGQPDVIPKSVHRPGQRT